MEQNVEMQHQLETNEMLKLQRKQQMHKLFVNEYLDEIEVES
jgi:hypothetical protein